MRTDSSCGEAPATPARNQHLDRFHPRLPPDTLSPPRIRVTGKKQTRGFPIVCTFTVFFILGTTKEGRGHVPSLLWFVVCGSRRSCRRQLRYGRGRPSDRYD
jgi:hypothetical protein